MIQISEKAHRFASLFDETKKAEIGGTAVGALIQWQWHAIHTHPTKAGWENAMRAIADNNPEFTTARSRIQEYRKKFIKVQHFWGALYIREGKFPDNIERFFTESEIVFKTLKQFDEKRHMRGNLPTVDVFHWTGNYLNGVEMKVGKLSAKWLPTPKKVGRPSLKSRP